MRSKPKIITVLLSAIIMFGTLFAILGKPPFAKYHSKFGHCSMCDSNAIEQK